MAKKYIGHPFGRFLSVISRTMLGKINDHLTDLDINRRYYALILIEEGGGLITQQEFAELT